ncbi:hypothetical protein [Caulobacter sp. UC70_42]|uniref:hypothetical protein n=1 Tax=Caulobacter sp. UC70_42 TaxID=3374551 RepID=UPI003756AAA5
MPADDHGFDYLNMAVSGGVGLMGAVIGAVLGYHLTKKTQDAARERDERDKAAFASFVMGQKIGRIYSCLTVINETFVDASMKSAAESQPYVFINAMPAANSFERVHFGPDELWRAGRIADLAFINGVTLLDEHFNGLISMLERYERERTALVEKVAAVGTPIAGGFQIDWNRAEFKQDVPKFEALDRLIVSIIEASERDRPIAHKAIIDLHKGTGRYLKKQNRIELTNLDGVPETIFALDDEAAAK